jgi:hypothetical protein
MSSFIENSLFWVARSIACPFQTAYRPAIPEQNDALHKTVVGISEKAYFDDIW